MQATALTYRNIHEHGTLFYDVLRSRHATFVETKGWDLPSHDGMEFDQYDTAQAVWLAIRREGRLVSSARIMPSTARCADYSYMIRDAQRKKLSSIPCELLYEEAPVCPTVWELTRGHVCPDVPSDWREEIFRFFTDTVISSAKERGARRVLTLTTMPLKRWGLRAGYDIIDMGPKITIGRPHQVVAFRIN